MQQCVNKWWMEIVWTAQDCSWKQHKMRIYLYSCHILGKTTQTRLVIDTITAQPSVQAAGRVASWRKWAFRKANRYFIHFICDTFCITSTGLTGSTQNSFKADFLHKVHETLFPSSQELLMSQPGKVHSALYFKNTTWNKFRGVQQELKQFWKGMLRWTVSKKNKRQTKIENM